VLVQTLRGMHTLVIDAQYTEAEYRAGRDGPEVIMAHEGLSLEI